MTDEENKRVFINKAIDDARKTGISSVTVSDAQTFFVRRDKWEELVKIGDVPDEDMVMLIVLSPPSVQN